MISESTLTDEALAEKAVAAVCKEDEDAANVRAGPIVRNFIGGNLVFVYFDYGDEDDEGKEDEEEDEADYEPEQHECYVHINEERPQIYWNSVGLARAVSAYKPTWWQYLVRAGAIPGTIAIVITLTICGLAASGRSNAIPEVLAAALTTILGFYFGSQVARR